LQLLSKAFYNGTENFMDWIKKVGFVLKSSYRLHTLTFLEIALAAVCVRSGSKIIVQMISRQ